MVSLYDIMMIIIYYLVKTPINFLCKQGLNPKSPTLL